MLRPSLYACCRKPINCRTYQIYLCKAPMRQCSINKMNYKDRSIFKSRLLQKMMHSILRNIFSEMLWFQQSLQKDTKMNSFTQQITISLYYICRIYRWNSNSKTMLSLATIISRVKLIEQLVPDTELAKGPCDNIVVHLTRKSDL